MIERPSYVFDLIFSIPEIVFNCSSKTSVTSLSITVGLAPCIVVETATRGKSTSGTRSIPMFFIANKPKKIRANVPINTVTGLRKEKSVIFIVFLLQAKLINHVAQMM
ncbi:hypothetical protein SDC9_176125 [bioreactor metagenome]|uniref:Uncharacterized protein n=1 Tax=bioreactor metagenome TaxID=1076179 RepID=A0A645GP42_9ZZZZ